MTIQSTLHLVLTKREGRFKSFVQSSTSDCLPKTALQFLKIKEVSQAKKNIMSISSKTFKALKLK